MKRTASPITAKYLQNAAVFYLERYASSAEGLRRVLRRRVSKARLLEAPVMDNVEEAIEAVVQKFVAAGLLDDKAFAQTKARSLHRRGVSGQLTRQRLQVAGVGRDDVDSALAALDEELGTDPARREIQAAVAFARRRRLGPFRLKDREERKARDLASMARAGFAYDLARKVIEATDPDSLDEARTARHGSVSEAFMSVTIWHNPRCSKSRQALDLLKSKGVEPAIREYLKQPPSRAEVEKLVAMVGGDPRELIRDGEAEFKRLKLKKADLTTTQIVDAIAAHPILLQRPIVVKDAHAAIGRPPEAVLSLLK